MESQFDTEKDIIDLNDIYRIYQYSQDIEKIYGVVNLLYEALNYVPDYSFSGYDALCICFHEEEIENVYRLVDAIIKEGINVYITSKNLYEKFKANNQPLRDFIILVYPSLPLHNIKFFITILSNAFINQLLAM